MLFIILRDWNALVIPNHANICEERGEKREMTHESPQKMTHYNLESDPDKKYSESGTIITEVPILKI